jgi:hypothetical protein
LRKFIIAVAALLVNQAAPAAGPVSGHFSVAGIQIGDRPAAALAALMREGYRIERTSRSDSFRQRLSDATNAELRHPSEKVRITDFASAFAEQGDQRIRVNFDDDATGSRVVSSVYYEASAVAHPFGRVRRMILDRYGRPRAEDGSGSVWCTTDPPDVCLAEGRRGERLKLGHDYRGFDPDAALTTIRLDAGKDLLDSWDAAFRSALATRLKSRDAF